MPWKVFKEGNDYCVFKLNADGSQSDKVKGSCKPSKQEANQQLKALYANEKPSLSDPQLDILCSIYGVFPEAMAELATLSGQSLEDTLSAIRDAFYEQFQRISLSTLTESPLPSRYIEKTYEGYAVVRDGPQLYKAAYSTDADGNITFVTAENWTKAKQEYVDMALKYKIQKKGGQFCVVDKGTGDSMKCYADMPAAMKGMATAHANASLAWDADVEGEVFAQFAADYPSELTAITKTESWGDEPASSYLVVEDPKTPSKWHLPVKKNGKLDHGLMGGAWAALISNHRGKGYGGPNKAEALTKLKAYYKSEGLKTPGQATSGFVLVELQYESISKPIDGMAAGTFDTSSGEVTFNEEDLPKYVENTQAVLESTREAGSGEIVGLPIDKDAHDHAGGAGWIIGLEHDAARKIIRLAVKWTEEGIALIKNNIRRYFSPSVDTENFTILGGSLTNWPASRNANGEYLLRPVELSKTMRSIDMTKTIEEVITENAALVKRLEVLEGKAVGDSGSQAAIDAELTSRMTDEELRELLSSDDKVEEMGRIAQAKVSATIAFEKRKHAAVEFASTICGGTEERPFGIRVRPATLVRVLLGVDPKTELALRKILEDTMAGLVEFSEKGSDGSNGSWNRKDLPAVYKPMLRSWIEAGNTVKSFFELNAEEVGREDDFNLEVFRLMEKNKTAEVSNG